MGEIRLDFKYKDDVCIRRLFALCAKDVYCIKSYV